MLWTLNFLVICWIFDQFSTKHKILGLKFKFDEIPFFRSKCDWFQFWFSFPCGCSNSRCLLKSHESKCLKVTMKCTNFQLLKSFTSFYFALLKFHAKILLEFSTRSVISVLSIYFRNYACNRICKHEVLCSLGVLLGWNIHYNLLFFDKWNTSQTNTALLLGIHFENHQLAQIIIKISLVTR